MKAQARLPDHAVLIPVLLGLSLVAWVGTAVLADSHMRLGVLTGGSTSAMGDMGAEAMTHSVALGLFMVTWLVMMVAMMFPAIAPVVLLYRRWAHTRGLGSTPSFVAGYLTIWGAIGLAFYGVLLALQNWVPAESHSAVRVGAVLLAGAGIYQLTPLKDACLAQCRSPLSFMMTHGPRLADGAFGPYKVGVMHGLYCLGCCWALMVVLVLLGMMNLVWMAFVAALILVEKVLPRGQVVARLMGMLLVVGAVVLFARPEALTPFV